MLTDSLPARHTPGSPWRVALLALVVMFVAPLAAQAQSATPTDVAVADIALEAQPLENALVELSRQSGIGIFAAGDLVEGLQAPPLNGSMTMEQALERLLEGTGLTWQRSAEGGYVVMPPNAGTADPAPEIADIDSARRAGVEEIIVTGQKKAERLQDVPIAISAFSMETLDAQKIEGGFDLLKAVPNVTFSKTNFSGYNFQIRGIGTQAISATTDPGVAVSFNNTTLIVNRLFEQEYLDIERVEVLRGPQGTLFGRNATGGVINVISAKPVMMEEFGEIKIEGGNYGAERLRGHYNLPIGDTVAIRGAYASTKRDGYGYNEYSEVTDNPFRDPVQPDVDNRDLWTGRLTVGWEPTDRLRVNLLYERFEEDDERVRTSKQLCTRDTGTVLDLGDDDDPSVVIGQTDARDYRFGYLSQGCAPGSLYADEAFQTPNGSSLPYLSAFYWANLYTSGGVAGLAGANNAWGLGGSPYLPREETAGLPGCIEVFGTIVNAPCDPNLAPGEQGPSIPAYDPIVAARCEQTGLPADGSTQPVRHILYPVDICNPDVFRGQNQSRDLRTISSQLEPQYKADSEIYELAFDYDLSDELLFSWQTVYAKDEYYATQDYNRFTAFPIWEDSSLGCNVTAASASGNAPAAFPDCSEFGQFADGFYAGLTPRPEGTAPGTPGVLCDPQLGCSDTLLIQDLSRSESRQFNQELRLVSSFGGPVNFSAGVNYTRFETLNDYFVFSNAFTHLLNFFPFNYHNSPCVQKGEFCRYVDPTSLNDIIAGQGGDGHNYFRNGNPYKLRSTALFGELYWQATETVKLTAGLRFTWDEKRFTPLPSQLLLGDYREAQSPSGTATELVVKQPGEGPEGCVESFVSCPLSGTAPGGRGYLAEPDIIQEWRVPTGRLVVDWQPYLPFTDETLVYASVARGYKGGGANPPSVAQPQARFFSDASGGFVVPPTFDAEYVNAFEIGTKNTLFGGGLILNGTAFYYDYTDYQVSKIVDRTAVNENFDATVWGLELESVIAPTPDLLFNVTVGYLRTRVGDGEQSIDLMDRADGGNRHFAADPDNLGSNNLPTDFAEGFSDWIVLQPDIKAASNCIAPRELVQADLLAGGALGAGAFCPNGNLLGGKSSAGTAYFRENGEVQGRLGTDRRWDPAKDAPNGGQGFFKDLSGNELPNAPRFTVSVGGQQTFYLSNAWSLTTRLDWYWQDESYARIYNFAPYDRLKAWTNSNLSVWVNQDQWGLKVEAYVKNLFDETPITGTFLNSDDSGLTTNIFTLDPRLFGLSITKSF